MVRKILGVIIGYVAMSVFVVVTFILALLVLGPDGAFKPGEFGPSNLWIAISFVLGFMGAVLAGLVCALIAKSSKPVMVLAGIALIMGLVLAIPALTTEPVIEERTEDLPSLEAMQKGQQPGWVALLNPLIGAAGILLGGRLRRNASSGV